MIASNPIAANTFILTSCGGSYVVAFNPTVLDLRCATLHVQYSNSRDSSFAHRKCYREIKTEWPKPKILPTERQILSALTNFCPISNKGQNDLRNLLRRWIAGLSPDAADAAISSSYSTKSKSTMT
jgi:hypothetical protein